MRKFVRMIKRHPEIIAAVSASALWTWLTTDSLGIAIFATVIGGLILAIIIAVVSGAHKRAKSWYNRRTARVVVPTEDNEASPPPSTVIEEYSENGWGADLVECIVCTYRWVTVAPLKPDLTFPKLTCPNCGIENHQHIVKVEGTNGT